MRTRNKAAKSNVVDGAVSQQKDCYEGERLVHLLKSIQSGIDSARVLSGNSLPEKIWLKQQFAIGVNDVTRVLERMAPIADKGSSAQPAFARLQAVLLAVDCNPKFGFIKKGTINIVKDDKKGSLRLGELVKLKTAMAIGVKARGNAINKIIQELLDGDQVNDRGAVLEVQ